MIKYIYSVMLCIATDLQMEFLFTLFAMPEKLKELMRVTMVSFTLDVSLSISSLRKYLKGPSNIV